MAKAKVSAAKAGKVKLSDEQLIKNIIARYGDVINLKKTPFLILEIIRSHGGVFETPDGGVSVAGVGTPPGPGRKAGGSILGSVVDNTELMKEILKLSKQVSALTQEVQRLKK